MSDHEADIQAALESTSPLGRTIGPDHRETANPREVRMWRKTLLKFLDECPEDATVTELRFALHNWSPEK